jgi:hypothetical protein
MAVRSTEIVCLLWASVKLRAAQNYRHYNANDYKPTMQRQHCVSELTFVEKHVSQLTLQDNVETPVSAISQRYENNVKVHS